MRLPVSSRSWQLLQRRTRRRSAPFRLFGTERQGAEAAKTAGAHLSSWRSHVRDTALVFFGPKAAAASMGFAKAAASAGLAQLLRKGGLKAVLMLLMACGVGVAASDIEQWLLHTCASHGLDEVLLALLHTVGGQIDINGKDDNGDTALHKAIAAGHATTSVLLVREGASLDAVNNKQQRASDLTDSMELRYQLKREAGRCDVMISYKHRDREFALRMQKMLTEHRVFTPLISYLPLISLTIYLQIPLD